MTTTFAPERFMGSSLTIQPSPPPGPAALSGETVDARVVGLRIEWPRATSRPWYVDLVEQELNRLIGLGDGWDGVRARVTTEQALRAVIRVLSALMGEESVPPQFFPLPDGGVQVEWLVGGNSIVIEVDAAGEAYVLATTDRDSVVAEGVLTSQDPDLGRCVEKFLIALSQRVHRAQ